jgi:hypothetical protein
VACDRPAIVREEAPIGVEGDLKASSHGEVLPGVC